MAIRNIIQKAEQEYPPITTSTGGGTIFTGVIGQDVVFTTGNQTINDLKNFTTRPTVNTVPVVLSGEAASSIEQFVKNEYGSTLYKAQPVYVTGSNGNNILVYPASNSGDDTSSKTFGLLKQTLLQNEQGYVVTEGPLLNVDTSMAAEGDPIWLGPTGNLIFGLTNKPKAPQHLVYLGFVERVHQNQGKIFVKVQNGFEIEELHDVRIINPKNNESLIYNSTSGIWLNNTVSQLIGQSSVGTGYQTAQSVLISGGTAVSNNDAVTSYSKGGDVVIMPGRAFSGGLAGTVDGNIRISGGKTAGIYGGASQVTILPGSINIIGGTKANDPKGGEVILEGNIHINPSDDNTIRDSRAFTIYKTPIVGIAGTINFQVREDAVNVNNVLLVSGVRVTPSTYVTTTGDQVINGIKTFSNEVYIRDLYVTGTQTIVNTTNTNVGNNYVILNATGGARDAGVFIVTGSGMTGLNDVGAIIGYDVPANQWVFGTGSRNSDLSSLNKIATKLDLDTTGSNLQTNINTVASNLESTGSNLQGQITSLTNVVPNFIVVGGNARGANLTIGTNDNFSLRFETNNLAKMTIHPSGEVGIGTTLAETSGADPGGLIVKESIKTFNHGNSSQWNYAYNQLTGLNLSPVTVNIPNTVTVTNGNFSNTSGMVFNGSDWYGGNVPGWTGPTDSTYAVYRQGIVAYTFYNNLNAGPKGPGTNALRQQVTTSLPVTSNIALNFINGNVAALGGTYPINAAIYTTGFQILASGSFAGEGAKKLVANNVPPNTDCIIAFWGSPQGALTNISVEQTGIYNTIKFNSKLPPSGNGLPSNSVYVDNNGFLKIV